MYTARWDAVAPYTMRSPIRAAATGTGLAALTIAARVAGSVPPPAWRQATCTSRRSVQEVEPRTDRPLFAARGARVVTAGRSGAGSPFSGVAVMATGPGAAVGWAGRTVAAG